MEYRGCEICGCKRVTWRGGAHICMVCSRLYDLWAKDNPGLGVCSFIAEIITLEAGGPMSAARKRYSEQSNLLT